jgi:hypothetical protein
MEKKSILKNPAKINNFLKNKFKRIFILLEEKNKIKFEVDDNEIIKEMS